AGQHQHGGDERRSYEGQRNAGAPTRERPPAVRLHGEGFVDVLQELAACARQVGRAHRIILRDGHDAPEIPEPLLTRAHRDPPVHSTRLGSCSESSRKRFWARDKRRLIVARDTPHARATSASCMLSMKRKANAMRSSVGKRSKTRYVARTASVTSLLTAGAWNSSS